MCTILRAPCISLDVETVVRSSERILAAAMMYVSVCWPLFGWFSFNAMAKTRNLVLMKSGICIYISIILCVILENDGNIGGLAYIDYSRYAVKRLCMSGNFRFQIPCRHRPYSPLQ